MAQLKTKVTTASVTDFLETIADEQKRKDSYYLLDLFKNITGEEAKMWGTSIIGFGQYHYKSERSSQEGDWPLTGFSPRKTSLTLYVMAGHKENDTLLPKLGKHTKSVGCLYIKKLADVDEHILSQIIKNNFLEMKKRHNA